MSKKTNIIIGIIIAVITLALVITAIVAAVKNGKQPDGPMEPPTDSTSTDKPDIPDPVIPPIDSDSGTDNPDDEKPGMGDIHIDVEQPIDGSRDDKPGIDGDVAIIPGVKGEDE